MKRAINLYLDEETIAKMDALVKNDGAKSKSEYVTDFVNGDYDSMIDFNNSTIAFNNATTTNDKPD